MKVWNKAKKEEKERKEGTKNERIEYEIKTDVFKKECIAVAMRDCITKNLKALNIHPAF
jgi:hypothetical protein